jgi:hypothetical protein
MKRSTWRKHHKWFGLLFCFFLLMFCFSGIVLNHRTLVSDINISRKCLPESYQYKHWNNALMRGTLPYTLPALTGKDAETCILIYGAGGIWQTDSLASVFADFNEGLPLGADYRNIRGVVQLPDETLFAAGQFGLYRYDSSEQWKAVSLPLDNHERLTDITVKGDTLLVLGRSYLYLSTPPYRDFQKIMLATPADYDGKVSLFRTVWQIHSGELFGTVGKVLMDCVALILIFLSVTGILFWLQPTSFLFYWHNRIGTLTILLTLFVAVTGWMLRPPVLIALVNGRVPAIPYTNLSSANAWNDHLRMLRFDKEEGDWLLSTSEGFYSLKTVTSIPVKITCEPPVSVMGLNVFTQDKQGHCLIGSFSGMYVWDRQTGLITDYFTYEPAPQTVGAPFGQRAVSGYSDDFVAGSCIVEYNEGTNLIPQPSRLTTLPMSLWNLCLEIHTGRIYTFLGAGTLIYIFFAGIFVVWILWSGYKVRKRR